MTRKFQDVLSASVNGGPRSLKKAEQPSDDHGGKRRRDKTNKKRRHNSPAHHNPRIRRVKLNLNTLAPPTPPLRDEEQASSPRSRIEVPSQTTSSVVKRKYEPNETTADSRMKKKKTIDINKVNGNVNITKVGKLANKEKERVKRERRRAEETTRSKEMRCMTENAARPSLKESTGSRRFLVGMSLARVSELPGKSVSENFSEEDLSLNNFSCVSLDSMLASAVANDADEALRRPIYFSIACKEKVDALKRRLNGASVCSKLLVVSEKHFKEVIIPGAPTRSRLPRLLDEQTLRAIEQSMKNIKPPRGRESGQNAEHKIKYLFEPMMDSLNLKDIVITAGFKWKGSQKIGLRSTTDLGTHDYGPKSDVAIYLEVDEKEAIPLIPFEAYSSKGRGCGAPSDRIRLLIQGAFISRRDAAPSVVFYLAEDKYMESILIFPDDENGDKFQYCVERQPFYTKATSLDLICKIINLV